VALFRATLGSCRPSDQSALHALWKRFVELLSTQVDGASLAVFRIFVGLEVVLTAWSLLQAGGLPDVDYVVTVGAHFTSPPANWHFPYHGFEWLRPWPEPGMTLHALLLLLAGLGVMLGCYYRVAIIVACAARTYLFLLDEAIYNNHYYLECLLLFLLAFMPAERCFSLDRWRRARKAPARVQPLSEVPFWSIFLLRAQLFLVYFYGGVTKLQPQYLLDGEPMKTVLRDPRIWLPYKSFLPAGAWGTIEEIAARPASAYLFGYSGLIYDLAIGFLLIFRRTRALGVVLTLVFHGLNHFFFFDDIGWFPLLGATSVTIFLEPDWPRRFWRAIGERRIPRPDWRWFIGGAIALPVVGAALGWHSEPTPRRRPNPHERIGALALACICTWVVFQAFWPLRHFAIAGDVNWTNEGERFSWRMKSNLKLTRSPIFRLEDSQVLGRDATGAWRIDWQSLGTPPTVYHDIAPAAIDWGAMPEFFVEYLPMVGERLIFNPRHALAADAELPTAEATHAKVQQLWQTAFGEELAPNQLVATQSLPVVLDGWRSRLVEQGAPAPILDAVQEARSLADEIESLSPGVPDYDNRLSVLQVALLRLLHEPEYGEQLKTALAAVVPFGTVGGRASGDGALVVADVPLDRQRLAPLGPAVQHVFAELERNAHWEWSLLPRTLVYADARGQYSLLWNQHADLLRLQDSMMQVRPYMIHQYANRIAELWEAEQGRRPHVYVTNFVQLVPRQPQLLIDPSVDLAAVPLVLFGHNGWILPLEAAR